MNALRYVSRLQRVSPVHFGVGVGLSAGALLALLALRVSPYTAAFLLVGLAFAVCCVIWPFLAFAVTAAMVPLERFGRFTDDSAAFTFSIMRVVGVLSLGAFLLHQFLRKRKLIFPPPLRWYGLYMALGMVSLSWSSDWNYGVSQAGTQIGNILFIFVAVNIVDDVKKARLALALWLFAIVAIGIFTTYEWHSPTGGVVQDPDFDFGAATLTTSERYATVVYDPESMISAQVRQKRAIGTTSHPATYGFNIILALPFFVYFLRTAKHRWMVPFIALGGVLAAYNAMLANTRAVLITLGFLLVVMIWTRLIRLKLWIVAACLLVVTATVALSPSDVLDRLTRFDNYFTTDPDTSFGARLKLMRASLEIISENPVFGIGLANQVEVPKRAKSDPKDRARSPHNDLLSTILQVGFVGFLFVLLFMVTIYRNLRLGEKLGLARGDPQIELFMTAARAQLYCILLFGLQGEALEQPIKGFWLTAGIAIAIVHSLTLHESGPEPRTSVAAVRSFP